MKDFLTKKQSINVSIHQQSTNSAYEVANQLRNELYDKLNTFRNKKSPINKEKSMFSVIPQASQSNTSLGSSKFKNLQISTDYPSIEA
jgi:DNA-binding PucR family transcriptional regulator